MGLKYMVFVQVDEAIQTEWRRWMRDIHIPDVMKTGAFVRVEFDYDPEQNTHLICYHCKDAAALGRYFREHAPELQQAHTRRYAGRFRARRYVMHPLQSDADEGLYA